MTSLIFLLLAVNCLHVNIMHGANSNGIIERERERNKIGVTVCEEQLIITDHHRAIDTDSQVLCPEDGR